MQIQSSWLHLHCLQRQGISRFSRNGFECPQHMWKSSASLFMCQTSGCSLEIMIGDISFLNTGFQAGPTFPTIPTFPYFFLCSYFSLPFFSENALLFSPKMFEVTKNCNFFPRLLEGCKNWINLIWAVRMQKFMKYFYFSCNSFFGTFI